MMDEPVVNERYGGITMRDMVRKVVLRRTDPVDDPVSESEKTSENEQSLFSYSL